MEGGDEQVGVAGAAGVAPGGAVTADARDGGEQARLVADVAEGEGGRTGLLLRRALPQQFQLRSSFSAPRFFFPFASSPKRILTGDC